MRTASRAAAVAAGTADAVNRNGRDGDPQVVDHIRRAGDEAPAARKRLREGAHAQVDSVLDLVEVAASGATGAEDADGMRLVDHQARPMGAAAAR